MPTGCGRGVFHLDKDGNKMNEYPGEYTVIVELDGETVLRFKGYADNPTDALCKAENQRDEELRERENNE